MKICHLADLHLTNTKEDSGETLDEQIDRLNWIANNAAESRVDLIVVAGDTFHARSNADERNAVVKVYQRLAEVAPVVTVRGNASHDGQGEIAFLGELKSKHEIHVFERPGEYITAAGDVIACLPFPEKHFLAAKLEPGQDVSQAAVHALRAILLGWKAKFEEYNGVRILLGHVELGLAVSDSGQPMVGKCFVEMSEEDLLDTGADYIALGHIHKFQNIEGRIVYSGSVRQCTFGEDNIKGYVLADVQCGKPPLIEHRKAPGRELITVEAKWEDNELHCDGGPISNLKSVGPKGSIIRLKYHVEDSDRSQAAEQAEQAEKRWIEAGGHSVKLDPRVAATYRVRSEEIKEARTNAERLKAYWTARGERPARAEAILEKLGELEMQP